MLSNRSPRKLFEILDERDSLERKSEREILVMHELNQFHATRPFYGVEISTNRIDQVNSNAIFESIAVNFKPIGLCEKSASFGLFSAQFQLSF